MLAPIKDILNTAPKGRALLGIDVGKKTLGLAICDENQTMALPMHTIKRTRFANDALAIKQIIDERKIGGIVVGWPISMDGSIGSAAQGVRDFAAELHNFLGNDMWIALQDERLSTAAANDMLAPKSRKKAKAKGHIDAIAAQVILQSALDLLSKEK